MHVVVVIDRLAVGVGRRAARPARCNGWSAEEVFVTQPARDLIRAVPDRNLPSTRSRSTRSVSSLRVFGLDRHTDAERPGTTARYLARSP